MSEKKESESEVTEEALKWPLPYNIGIDKLDLIIKAFYRAGADKQKVNVNNLLGSTGLNANTIKGNLKFLIAIRIIKPSDEKDFYLFETKGATYAQALDTGNEKTSSATLKELLTDSYLKQVISYVELQKSAGLTFEQLFQHIKGMARLEENPKYRYGVADPHAYGIMTMIDLLKRAGIVSQDVMPKKETVRTLSIGKKRPTQRTEPQLEDVQKPATLGGGQETGTRLPFTVNITVEAKDAESIKQLISLIKELRGQADQSNS